MNTKYTFIVNNQARDGQGKSLWQAVESYFLTTFPEARVVYPQTPQECTELAKLAAQSDSGAVIGVGGEGTMNHVLQGVLAAKRTDVTIGAVPFGNVNDYTNNLGIHKDWRHALQVLEQGNTRQVGVVEMRTEHHTAYALNIADLGFGASTAQRHSNGELAWLKGRVKYNALALKTLWSWYNIPARIQIDDDVIEADLSILLAGYSPTLGGFEVIPHAHVDNQQMAITLAHSLTRMELLHLLQATKKHNLQQSDKVRFYNARQVVIEALMPLVTEVDGEIADQFAQRIEMLAHPQRLRFLCP